MKRLNTTRRKSPFSHLGELLDASALGIVTLLLLAASFFATWRGMGDFVTGNDIAAGAASTGLVLLIVITLTLAMYVALREMISPYYVRGWFSAIWKRLIAAVLYAVLAFWSIGFGYGFWWSLVAGQDATEAELTRSVASIRAETSDVRARLAAAASVMVSAEDLSNRKAEREALSGGTCGVSSPPGEGPLARARAETQAQIASLSATVRADWLEPMTARLDGLAGELQGALDETGSGEARKARFEALGQKTQTAAEEIGADARARGRTLAAQLRAKAAQLSAVPVDGRVAYCHDPDLAASLNAAADELDQDFNIRVTPFRYSEGAEGVARAVEDLWMGLAAEAGFPPVAGRAPPAPPSGRGLIALLATIGVDLALFVFALLRGGPDRERTPAPDGPEGAIIDVTPVPAPAAKPKSLPTAASAQVAGPKIRRIEARPGAVGIGTSDVESHSQLRDDEQVSDLMSAVSGIYDDMGGKEALGAEGAEIERLNAELARLKQLGYIVTGRPGQPFDAIFHKAAERRPHETVAGTIIVTLRPGYLTDGPRVYRMAEVIVSAGPNPFDYDG